MLVVVVVLLQLLLLVRLRLLVLVLYDGREEHRRPRRQVGARGGGKVAQRACAEAVRVRVR